jgi:hypothetical protein
MSMKKTNDTIGNRTRDLPGCSKVLQPTAPPRAPHPRLVRSKNVFFLTSVLILENTNPPLKRHNTCKWRKSECWPRKSLHAVLNGLKHKDMPLMDNLKFYAIGGNHFRVVQQLTRCTWPVYRFLNGCVPNLQIIFEVYREKPVMLDNCETSYSNDFCLCYFRMCAVFQRISISKQLNRASIKFSPLPRSDFPSRTFQSITRSDHVLLEFP